MINRIISIAVLLIAVALVSCKKDNNDSNTLGGDTNIDLTKVDSVSGVYAQLDGGSSVSVDIKVKSNNNGEVTYTGTLDLLSLPADLQSKALEIYNDHGDYYEASKYVTLTPDMKLNFEFTVRITSEGYMDYFTNDEPWVMVKYNDPEGTKYTVTNKNGETLTRTVTEKTGQDDWPYGFFYIKTSKVEQEVASDDPLLASISYRANDKFGLVYLEYNFLDGTTLEIDLFPWFLF